MQWSSIQLTSYVQSGIHVLENFAFQVIHSYREEIDKTVKFHVNLHIVEYAICSDHVSNLGSVFSLPIIR